MGVGEMGWIRGKTGVDEMRVGEMGVILTYRDGALMQWQLTVKKAGNVSDWLFYTGGDLKEVAD